MPFQTIFDFRTSTRLIYGQGSLTSLPECFPDSRKILVVTDPGLIGAGIVDRVTAPLEDAGLSHAVFSAIQGDPRSAPGTASTLAKNATASSPWAAAAPWTLPR